MICPIHTQCANSWCLHKNEHDHSIFGCHEEGRHKCTIWDTCERKKICDGYRFCISTFEYEFKEIIKNESNSDRKNSN